MTHPSTGQLFIEMDRMEKAQSRGSIPSMGHVPREGKVQSAADNFRDEHNASRMQSKGWREAFATYKAQDDIITRDYEGEVDTLLVFAGLFSAVLTAFIIEVYQRLEEDSGETSTAILRRISTQLEGSATIEIVPLPPAKYAPKAAIVVVNALWFTSLILSLFTALFGILAKQWIRVYSKWSNGARPVDMLALRDFYQSGFDNWRVPDIIAALPTFLQLALLLFVIGLSIYMWTLNIAIAIIVSALTAAMVLAAVGTIFLPIFYPNCPYKSPLGLFFAQIRSQPPYPNTPVPTSPGSSSLSSRFSSWRDLDSLRVTRAMNTLPDPVDRIISDINLLLDLRPKSILEQVLKLGSVEGSVVAFRLNDLRESSLNAFLDLVFSSMDHSGPNHTQSPGAPSSRLQSLLEYSASMHNESVVDLVRRHARIRWPDETTSSRVDAALFISRCFRNMLSTLDRPITVTCLTYLNRAATALLKETEVHEVPSAILPMQNCFGPLSDAFGFWLETATMNGPRDTTVTTSEAISSTLRNICRAMLSVTQSFEFHSNWVCATAFSHDGSIFASGSDDKTIKIWRVDTLEVTHTLTGHEHAVQALAFNTDGSRIVSGSKDKTVRIWNLITGACIITLVGHSQQVNSVIFSSDDTRVISGANDRTAQVWDIKKAESIMTIRESSDVGAVAISQDGTWIATGANRNVQIWNAHTGTSVTTLNGNALIKSVAFTPDGIHIHSYGHDGSTCTWSLQEHLPSAEHDTTPPFPKATSLLATYNSSTRWISVSQEAGGDFIPIHRLPLGDGATSSISCHGSKIAFGTKQRRVVFIECGIFFS